MDIVLNLLTTVNVLAAIGVAALLYGVAVIVSTLQTALRDIKRLEARWDYLDERQDKLSERGYKCEDRLDNLEGLIAKEAVKTLKK